MSEYDGHTIDVGPVTVGEPLPRAKATPEPVNPYPIPHPDDRGQHLEVMWERRRAWDQGYAAALVSLDAPSESSVEAACRAWAEVTREQTNAALRDFDPLGDVGGWDDWEERPRAVLRTRMRAALAAGRREAEG